MLPPQSVLDWVNTTYPRPRVDPEWLKACYEWLTTEQGLSPTQDLPTLLEQIEEQLLQSDLRDSMLHGTGLPTHIAHPETATVLRAPPVLVEITSITDIGVSAWNLNQTRIARNERRAAGVVEVGDGDEEVDEGPIPKYARSMLKFELTDGAITMQAIEYRSIPELVLGETRLGFKLLLKNVVVRGGVAHLEPRTVELKGFMTEAREENQEADLERSLCVRLGLPEPSELVPQNPHPAPVQVPIQPLAPAPANPRSPLRDLSPRPSLPPSLRRNDDEDLEPRRRRIPSHTPAPRSSSTLVGTVIPSPYFSSATTPSSSSTRGWREMDSAAIDLTLSPVTRHTPLSISSGGDDFEDQHSWLDDEIAFLEAERAIDHNLNMNSSNTKGKNKLPPTSNSATAATTTTTARTWKGKGRASNPLPESSTHDDSSEFGGDDMVMDDEFLEGLDKVEMEALGSALPPLAAPPPSQMKRREGSPPAPPSSGSKSSGSAASRFDSSTLSKGSSPADTNMNTRLTPLTKTAYQRSQAPATFPTPGPINSTMTRVRLNPKPGPRPRPMIIEPDVITIEDDGDDREGWDKDDEAVGGDDKENVPVPTRHVRRRTLDEGEEEHGLEHVRASTSSGDTRATAAAATREGGREGRGMGVPASGWGIQSRDVGLAEKRLKLEDEPDKKSESADPIDVIDISDSD